MKVLHVPSDKQSELKIRSLLVQKITLLFLFQILFEERIN